MDGFGLDIEDAIQQETQTLEARRRMASEIRQYLHNQEWEICDQGDAYCQLPCGSGYRYRFDADEVAMERRGPMTEQWFEARRWTLEEALRQIGRG